MHAQDGNGTTPLDHALEPEPEVEWWEGHEKVVRLLMRAGAQLNPKSVHRRDLLLLLLGCIRAPSMDSLHASFYLLIS